MTKSLLTSPSLIGCHFTQQPIVFSGITKSVAYFNVAFNMCAFSTDRYNVVESHFLVGQYGFLANMAPHAIAFKDTFIGNFFECRSMYPGSSNVGAVAHPFWVRSHPSAIAFCKFLFVSCIVFSLCFDVRHGVNFTQIFYVGRSLALNGFCMFPFSFIPTIFAQSSMSISLRCVHMEIFDGLCCLALTAQFRENNNRLGAFFVSCVNALFTTMCMSKFFTRIQDKSFQWFFSLTGCAKFCGWEKGQLDSMIYCCHSCTSLPNRFISLGVQGVTSTLHTVKICLNYTTKPLSKQLLQEVAA